MTSQEHFPIDVVGLSESFDLCAVMAEASDPRIRLLRPEDIEDPTKITCALAWRPASEDFAAYPNLKMVSSIAAGVDSIIGCPSLPENAIVTRVRDEEQARMMAGFAVWNVVYHHRKMGEYLANQATQSWDRAYRAPVGSDVTIGILGFGLMGRHTARALATLGYRVIAASRSGGEPECGVELVSGADAIQNVAKQSDMLINLLPLTDATRDVLNAELFSTMPKGAVLIQLGRGEHLVEEDLIPALDNGTLSAASLDVFREEPLPEGHAFWSHPDIVVTPHKASDTTRAEILRQMAENYTALIKGNLPPGAVNRTAGY